MKKYYSDKIISITNTSEILHLQFGSDTLFNSPVARHAFLQSKYTDVFFYQFSYIGKLGKLVFNNTIKGNY